MYWFPPFRTPRRPVHRKPGFSLLFSSYAGLRFAPTRATISSGRMPCLCFSPVQRLLLRAFHCSPCRSGSFGAVNPFSLSLGLFFMTPIRFSSLTRAFYHFGCSPTFLNWPHSQRKTRYLKPVAPPSTMAPFLPGPISPTQFACQAFRFSQRLLFPPFFCSAPPL